MSRSAAIAVLVAGAALAEPSTPATSTATLMVVADPAFSMEPGVRTLDSLTPLLFAYDAVLTERLGFDESTPARKAAGIVGRLAKAALVDVPLVELQDTLAHEVFGHGARAREFGQSPVYAFQLPLTYRFLSGPTDYSGITYFVRTGLLDSDVPITAAGLEANYFEAYWTEARALRNGGQLHYSELLRYVNEKASYLPRWLAGFPPGSGGQSDPDEYVDELQRRFNRYTPESRAETARALTRAYAWNAVDPTLWLSVYHLVFTYGYRGERVATLPRFGSGETWLYPGTRFNLSPFGAEHYLDLFAGRGTALVSAYLRVGSSFLASYVGAGARAAGLDVGHGLTLGGEVDVWRQPELLYEYRNAFDGRTLVGGGAAVHFEWRAWKRLGLVAKLAAKTRGYLMGQPLAAGPYGYLGASVALGPEPR